MALDSETGYRMSLVLMIACAAGIGIPHRLRADRASGHVSIREDPAWFWIATSVAGPPLALSTLAFIIQPRWVAFATFEAAPWVRWLGGPIALLGVALFAWMFRHLGLNVTSTSMPRATASLVTTGPYRWMRHPMYTAALILIVATTLLTANIVVAVCGIIMFALLAARSRVEERRLVEKFGNDYRVYQRRTGRFLPCVRQGHR